MTLYDFLASLTLIWQVAIMSAVFRVSRASWMSSSSPVYCECKKDVMIFEFAYLLTTIAFIKIMIPNPFAYSGSLKTKEFKYNEKVKVIIYYPLNLDWNVDLAFINWLSNKQFIPFFSHSSNFILFTMLRNFCIFHYSYLLLLVLGAPCDW